MQCFVEKYDHSIDQVAFLGPARDGAAYLIQCSEAGSKSEVYLVHKLLENDAGLRIFIVCLEKSQGEATVGY